MGDVVKLQKRYYPVIIRVVMDRQFGYYAGVLELATPYSLFSMPTLKKIFKIDTDDDWLGWSIESWKDATMRLTEKVTACMGNLEKSPPGSFVTIRPRYGEVLVLDHPPPSTPTRT